MAAPDVLVVGGGPAGAIAAVVAARAGARVRILERATFPRDKLCGDTLNPGALALLRRFGVAAAIDARGLSVAGMIVTGGNRVEIVGRYPDGLRGRAIVRRDLDAILLDAAVRAGCQVDEGVVVRSAVVDESRGARRVSGVVVAGRNRECTMGAPVVIGADGRRSVLAFGLGLVRHPRRPRRWAVGAYFTDVADGVGHGSDTGRTGVRPVSDPCPTPKVGLRAKVEEVATFGEMHVRRNCYIGVAPVPGGLTNVCLVREAAPGDAAFRDPAALLTDSLNADPILRDRFRSAVRVAPPVTLGPLAVDATGSAIDGLLLTGDAAGFIDPMTGDGLRFAIRGGELAADAALRALTHGWDDGVHARYAAARADAFAGKWRFNRALRGLVASPRAVDAAALGARVAPAILRAVISRAGDCGSAS